MNAVAARSHNELRRMMEQHCPQCQELHDMEETEHWEGTYALQHDRHFNEGASKKEAAGTSGGQHSQQLRHNRAALVDDGTLVRTNEEQDLEYKAALQVWTLCADWGSPREAH